MEDFSHEPSDQEAVDIFRHATDNTPQDAVKTINRAEQSNMHPDSYEKMKTTLDPEFDIHERVPSQVGQALKTQASKSSNHAKLMKNETGILNTVYNQGKHVVYNLFQKQKIENDKLDLIHKKRLNEGVLPPHEQGVLDLLDQEEAEKEASFELEGFEKVPGQVAGVVNDAFRAIGNNKLLIGGLTAAGAFTPVPFAAGAGFGFGVTAAFAKEAYFKITEMTYHELTKMKGDDGQPLDLSHNQMDNISMSVGAVSGLMEAATGGVLTFGLRKLLIPKGAITKIIKNTALKTSMDILGHTIKSAAVSGTEETTAEIVAIIGENFAKGSQSMPGLINAMNKTVDDIVNDPKVRKRIGMTAVVGFAAGGTIAGTTSSLTAKKIKGQYDKLNLSLEEIERQKVQSETIKNAIKSLSNQDDMVALAKLSLSTELKELSPEQMTEFRKEMFNELGYEDKVWFSDTDIEVIAESNPELAQKIKQMDVTEASNSGTKSSVAIDPHQFLDLVEESPTVSEFARLHPEAPNPLESKTVLENYQKAEEQRKAIFASLGKGEEFSPEQIEMLKNLDKDIQATTRDVGEAGYIVQTEVFTEAMETVIPDKQIESYKKAQLEAREAVAKQVNQEFEAREIAIENRVVKANEKIDQKIQLESLKKELELVEKFKPIEIKENLTIEQEVDIAHDLFVTSKHKKKGYSPLAIDPENVPDNLRTHLSNSNLAKHKVFVEGGITLDESAALAGVENGETLLKMLADTPTKKELLEARRKKSRAVRKQVREVRSKTLNERRNKVFDDVNKLHLKDLKFIKEHKWPANKQGIKTIVLPTPRIPELNNTAKKVVAKTKVGELNPRQFNASEKNLNRKAANHILKNEAEEAHIAKERAMLNVELTRESLRAKQEVDEAKVFIKKLTSPDGLKVLKKSGLLPKVNELLDLFNMLPSKKKGIEQDTYFEHLKRLDAQGKSVIVPKSLADIRQRGTDLTVEEYLRVSNRLRTLNHQAKQRNKIIKRENKVTKAVEFRTEEAIVSVAEEDLRLNHPSYDTRKFNKIRNKNSIELIDKMKEKYGLTAAAIGNLKNVTVELDQEALIGQHSENLAQPMVKAETFKRSKLSDVVTQIKKIADQYGSKNFTKAFNDFIEIEEFKGYYELGDGVMSRSDMWTLFAYLGDPQARDRIGNFINADTNTPMNIETVKRVLNQHLTQADARLAQNFVNIFKSFTQEAADLHERTTGVIPNMVKGVPIEHKGKMLDGGYVPNNYLNTSRQEKLNRFLEVLGEKSSSMFGEKKDGKLYGRLRAAEMTDQGRMIDRTGSSRPLDTDFMNFLHAYEEHIHDIAYREAGIDTLKLLRNEAYTKSIISTVGEEKYNTIGNAIIETVGNPSSEDVLNPFSKEQKWADNLVNVLSRNFAVATLGFKATSVAMQPLSFGAAVLRMGPTGGRYVVKALGKIIKNAHNYSKMFDDAALINNDIRTGKDSVDDTLVKSYFSEIPKSQRTKHSQALATLSRAKQSFVDASMIGLKKLDLHIKVVVTLASYSQFMEGNVKNFPLSKLDEMSDVEKISKAKQYSKQIADLALTTSATIDKSAVEKISQLRMFTMFYTDLRSQLNTSTSQMRKIKNSTKRVIADVKNGDLITATGNFKTGAVDFAALFAVHTMAQMYTSLLYDQETPLDELSSVSDMEDFKNFLGSSVGFIAAAPVKGILGSTIISRDLMFALSGNRRSKTVSFPLNRVFSDFAMSASGMIDILKGGELNSKQIKSSFYATSVVTGLPLMEVVKFANNISDSDLAEYATDFVESQTQKLAKEINKYIDNNPSEKENIKQLEAIKKDLIPAEDQDVEVPEDSLEVLKLNDWKDIDPDTGAVGVYQFTEDRWNEIILSQPSLGLTENGRVSKDSSEQERAMEWSLKDNATGLTAYLIPVNNVNLYGAHRFGLDDYTAIFLSKNNEKVNDIVENKELFDNFKTVKSVKDYISSKVKDAETD